MSRSLIFDGVVKKGRFLPDDPDMLRNAFRSREGKRSRLTFGAVPRGRSIPQLKYYWGVLIEECVKWSGADPDDFHEEFLEQVMRPMLERKLFIGLPNGKRLQGRPTTTTLTLEEMTEYISRCKDYAYQEWEVEVPDIDHVSMR